MNKSRFAFTQACFALVLLIVGQAFYDTVAKIWR